MILDQKQKQFWNRHAKRNNNPRDANVSVLLGVFVSRSTKQGAGADADADSAGKCWSFRRELSEGCSPPRGQSD